MGVLLDISFFIIVLLCVIFGYRKGFVKSIVGFVGSMLAMFIAWTLGGLLARAMYQGIFRGMLVDQISDILLQNSAASATEQAASIIKALPDFLSKTLNSMGVTSTQIENSLPQAGSQAAQVTADLLSPAVIWLLQLLLTAILFFILLIVIRLVVNMLGNVLRWPILRQADGILGAVFGMLKGAVYIFFACVLLQLIMPLTGSSAESMQQVLDSSFIFRFIFIVI